SVEDSALGRGSARIALYRWRVWIRYWRRKVEGTPDYFVGHHQAIASAGVQTTRGGRGPDHCRKVAPHSLAADSGALRWTTATTPYGNDHRSDSAHGSQTKAPADSRLPGVRHVFR